MDMSSSEYPSCFQAVYAWYEAQKPGRNSTQPRVVRMIPAHHNSSLHTAAFPDSSPLQKASQSGTGQSICQVIKPSAPLSSGSPFTYKLTPRITRMPPRTRRDAASQTLRSYVCITYAGAASPVRLDTYVGSGCCHTYPFTSFPCCI